MNPHQLYWVDGEPRDDVRVRTLRLGRLELCAVRLPDEPLPSLIFFLPFGRCHPGAVSFTLRVQRVMVGFRWYQRKTT